MPKLTAEIAGAMAEGVRQLQEMAHQKFCTNCGQWQPAHQEERDETCLYVCDVCDQIIDESVPF